MNNLFEQWNEGLKLFQQMPPLNGKILESFTVASPKYLIFFANIGELSKIFRVMTGTELNTKIFEGFPYLKSGLMNFKNAEELLQSQMGIMFELGYNTLDYMQKSFQIMEKEILLLMKMAKYKSEEKQ